MDSKEATERRSVLARLLAAGAGLLLLMLLVTPGDAAPGVRPISPTTTIGIQQALSADMVALGGGHASWVWIPDWLRPRSPYRPPWLPKPIPIPGPPVWVPKPPFWRPGPPIWIGWP